VSGKHQSCTLWNLINLVNKYCSALFQSCDNVLVVNDFFANIDRSAVMIQRLFDSDYGSIHTSAVASRGGQKHAL
jgi:hypothetical protein